MNALITMEYFQEYGHPVQTGGVVREVRHIKEVFERHVDGNTGADPGFFLGGGALVSCSTSTPINHIVFFYRIPVVLENRRSSQGGGGDALPLHPSPRSAPVTPSLSVRQVREKVSSNFEGG